MLKTKEILDEKDKRLRVKSKDVEFPLKKEDKELIDTMIEYLHNSQIDELAEKGVISKARGPKNPAVHVIKGE